MAKPTSKPDWTVGNASFGTVTIEPSAGKKQTGWTKAERPPFQIMNWLFYNINDWINYFEAEVDAALAAKTEYDAVVGVGGTHATLADLMADADTIAGLNKNILVVSPQTLTAPVTIAVDFMRFFFKPGATLFKGTGANRALVIDSNSVKIVNARIENFNGGSDIGILLDTNAKNCIITQCSFLNNTLTVQDDGSNNALVANIDEVP